MLDGHPEMARHLDGALIAIRRPDVITPDDIPGRWCYWQAGVGPTRWLFVVVDWRPEQPELITAFGRRKIRL